MSECTEELNQSVRRVAGSVRLVAYDRGSGMTKEQIDFHAKCTELRMRARDIEIEVRHAMSHIGGLPDDDTLHEVSAHMMLAVRHLEDARMRLGKAVQYACGGGVSVYEPKGE